MNGVGPYRLERGGLVDRTRSVPFTFNGKLVSGFAGDTLASALLANGTRTVARSLKFHRPRGVFSCGIEEPNALLQLGCGKRSIASARAPLVELTEGLAARSQAGWPALTFDMARILDFTAPLWAAGFYNKTFIWPGWHVYEGIIRRLTGLGRTPRERDPDRYEVGNLHCDVLIIGAGLSGLEAALEAGRMGQHVLLAEHDSVLGGRAAWNGACVAGAPATERIAAISAQLAKLPRVKVLRRTTAVGYYDHNVVGLLERSSQGSARLFRERYWVVRTKRVVLATGALEQPLVFDHNDRPGIFLLGAAHQYALRYGVAPGRRVVIAANNDTAYEATKALCEAGVSVVAVVDSRQEIAGSLRATLKGLPMELLPGSIPIDSAGFSALRSVVIGKLSADASSIVSRRKLDCDSLLVSGGWSPTLHLYAQAGGRLAFDAAAGFLRPATRHDSIDIIGSAAAPGDGVSGPRASPVGKPNRQWVDLLHDVTVADIELALREQYSSVEHVKRYTTVGMAADQGKTSSAVTIEIVARLRGMHPGALGHTTMRPPYTPVTLGALAGRDINEFFAPRRLLPMHACHVKHGALFQDFGGWQRPVAYVHSGESREQACAREARAVRSAAGLFDSSPLGKIEIQGPDALTFLDRLYINNLRTLKPGAVRYGIMLRETGVIFDDGTITMLTPDHVLITTTSANAALVCAWLEEWRQCEWRELRVAVTSVGEQWATLTLTGPHARTILSRLPTDIDLSPQAFPHLSLRTGQILGRSARVHRVSFTGELAYEINVPAGAGPELWDGLIEAGAADDIQPFGIDAMLLLRLQKGFLHVGTDTDGSTVPDDVGWGRAADNKAADFVGKRSLSLPENRRPDRLQLVGLAGNAGTAFIVGSHLRLPQCTAASDGWISSVGTSMSGDPIALAMLRGGRKLVGKTVSVHNEGRISQARIVTTPFYDASATRMNA